MLWNRPSVKELGLYNTVEDNVSSQSTLKCRGRQNYIILFKTNVITIFESNFSVTSVHVGSSRNTGKCLPLRRIPRESFCVWHEGDFYIH